MNEVNGLSSYTATTNANTLVTASADSSERHSWYEAMARAWGNALDKQAGKVTTLSEAVSSGGQDNPSTITILTAESMRMQFIANNASTATNAVGHALEALARKG